MLTLAAVFLVYAGLLLVAFGLLGVIKPIRRLGLRRRSAGALVAGLGLLFIVLGAALPAPLEQVARPGQELDRFLPAYQFKEHHERRIHGTPDEVYRALRQVTAREIRLFRLLTWIRSPRLGAAAREDILSAPADQPILDVAKRSGFLVLSEEPGHELVVGTLVCGRLTGLTRRPEPADFLAFDRPGFCKAAMNFRIDEEGGGWSRLTTETRVYAIGDAARRGFAVYWRIIYPGSSLIRRMWLDAIKRRTEAPA